MSDTSFSEDENGGYDSQSSRRGQFPPAFENTENMDTQSFHKDFYFSPIKKFVSLSDTQSSKSDCSSDKKSELSDTQSSEKDCPSNKNSELLVTQSSESDCFLDKKSELSDILSSENDCSSDKKSELSINQSSEIDYSSSDKEHEYSYSESSESSSSFPNEKHVLTHNQPSENNCTSLNKIQELIETQASEKYFSFPDKRHKLTNAQLSESASHSPDEKHLLSYDHQLFNDDCPFSDTKDELNNTPLLESIHSDLLSDSQSLKSDSSTLGKKYELINVQSPKSDCSFSPICTQLSGNDCSFLKERHELTETQSSRSFCSDYPVDIQSLESNLITNPSERCTSANTQVPKNGNSSTLSEKHNLTNTELQGNVGSFPSDERDENYTHSAENDCSSLKRKISSPFLKSDFSSLNKKRNLSDIQLPNDDCSFIPENCIKTHLPEIDLSLPNESSYLPEINRSPSSHGKHKLTVTDFSDSDCSSDPGIKRKLLCKKLLENGFLPSAESVSIQTSGSDWFPSHERHENDELLNSILLNKNSDGIKVLQMLLNNDCKEEIGKIIRTAYQFTRHSNREKLTLKDLEKSFKIHKVDMTNYSDGLVDFESVEEDEFQSITCSGKWLRRPENMSKKE